MGTAFSANLQEAATATGNGDALKVIGAALVLFDLSVTVGTATVTFEATGNSGTYVALPVTDLSTGTTATTATASGIYRADVRGLSFVRARISAIAGGGVVSVWAVSIDAPGAVSANSATGAQTVTLGSGSAHAGTVGALTKVVSASFTRPADTTAYAAGDAVNNSTSAPTVLTFTSAARVSGGSGLLIGASMTKSTNGSTGDVFDLHLFDTTVTLANDNAADATSDAEALTYLGTVNFSAATDLGANNRAYVATGVNLPFVTVGSANLFGKLVARGAYAPGNAEVFNIRLLLTQD